MPWRELFQKGKEPDIKAALRTIGCPACSDKLTEEKKKCGFCIDGKVPRVTIVSPLERKVAEKHRV